MSIRKRTWRNADGSRGESWTVFYRDQGGKRHNKSFDRRRDADAYHAAVTIDVRAGTHVADRDSVTVAEAAHLWLDSCDLVDPPLERSTIAQYRQHVALHIVPFLGAVKLSQLTAPMVRHFEDMLRKKSRSPAMVRKIRSSLGTILADAQERGLVGQNVVHSLRVQRRKNGAGEHRGSKLKVGVDIPTPDEIRAILARLDGRWRPILLTAIFTGLRSSELRGLRWSDVDLKCNTLQVQQRADCFNAIGAPKSEAGERTLSLPPMVANTLREWKLICPKGELDLVFPNGAGRIENHANIVNRGFVPVQKNAGVTIPVLNDRKEPVRDKDGRPVVRAKYTGLHSLRHFFASWCINRKVDGGRELPLKVVQAQLGHASIQMTADRYGHLFPRGDDSAELAAAEKSLIG